MKRVLIISDFFPPYVGGIGQTTRVMVRLLKQSGIESKVICFNEDAQQGNAICHRGETVHDMFDGIEVIRCGCFTKIFSQSLSLTLPGELKRVLDDFNPNIVIFHYPNPYEACFLLKYLRKDVKLIVYYNLDITKQKILGKLFHGQTIKLLERANAIVALSPNYIQGSSYLKKYQNKCTVIPCCVQEDRFSMTTEVLNLQASIRKKYENKTICFAVGRHVPYKGMEYLIEASRYLSGDFAILIGGKGPLTESLREKASGDDKVEFLELLSDVELSAYYAVCDIFCFPSITKNESFGIALAEAMSFGKPAVTFTIPGSGVNYVNLNGVTGIECPNGDSKAYAEALQKLADNPALREEYGRNAQQRVAGNFTTEQFQRDLYKLLQTI